jgi:hypothetical protein
LFVSRFYVVILERSEGSPYLAVVLAVAVVVAVVVLRFTFYAVILTLSVVERGRIPALVFAAASSNKPDRFIPTE